jgi:hypothetical protein
MPAPAPVPTAAAVPPPFKRPLRDQWAQVLHQLKGYLPLEAKNALALAAGQSSIRDDRPALDEWIDSSFVAGDANNLYTFLTRFWQYNAGVEYLGGFIIHLGLPRSDYNDNVLPNEAWAVVLLHLQLCLPLDAKKHLANSFSRHDIKNDPEALKAWLFSFSSAQAKKLYSDLRVWNDNPGMEALGNYIKNPPSPPPPPPLPSASIPPCASNYALEVPAPPALPPAKRVKWDPRIPASPNEPALGEEALAKLSDGVCGICVKRPPGVVLLPCGDLRYCATCMRDMEARTSSLLCPYCQTEVKEVAKVFHE